MRAIAILFIAAYLVLFAAVMLVTALHEIVAPQRR